MRLRDLLKFEFYFADTAAFRRNIAEEMDWHANWEDSVSAGVAGVNTLLEAKRPMMAHAMLRPFIEAYSIVADVLCDASADIGEKELTERALGLGRQYAAQKLIRSNEAVSALLFTTARQVVADQGLLTASADLPERRRAFRAELRAILADMDRLNTISLRQFISRETQRSSDRVPDPDTGEH